MCYCVSPELQVQNFIYFIQSISIHISAFSAHLISAFPQSQTKQCSIMNEKIFLIKLIALFRSLILHLPLLNQRTQLLATLKCNILAVKQQDCVLLTN